MSSGSKSRALAQLLQSKFTYDRGQQRQQATRRARLDAFLSHYQEAGQWAASLAAIEDAVRGGVRPSDAALCDAITQCGKAGRLDKAARVYRGVYRRLRAPRTLAAHVAFMGACASCGDYAAARAQFQQHVERDRRQHARHPTHQPVVTDDLTTEYLRAALAASSSPAAAAAAPSSSSSSSSPATGDAAPPWQRALEDLVAIRSDAALFRPHNALTPLMLEAATQLAEVGGQWDMCLRLVRAAEREQLVVPPEAYDAVIRACYRAHQHGAVVATMESLIATRTAPDERSVRLALVSAEEVAAREAAEGTALAAASPSPAGSHQPLQQQQPRAWALALQLFHAMEHNGVPLYQQSFEAPLRACAASGRWAEALEMLAAMRRHRRPVSGHLYAAALAARIEACGTAAEAERLLRLPVAGGARGGGGDSSAPHEHMYLAAMRCCMRLRDWRAFDRLQREMRGRDVPESYAKMQLLIEAAHARGDHRTALLRFARFDSVTGFERRRAAARNTTRRYDEDFELPARVLDLVLDSYERLTPEQQREDLVRAAHAAAQRRKEAALGRQQLPFSHNREKSFTEPWMFSDAERREKQPSRFY